MPRIRLTKHHFTKKELHHLAWGVMGVILVAEGLLAWHLISKAEMAAGGLVVTAWFRDAVSVLIEHLVFEA